MHIKIQQCMMQLMYVPTMHTFFCTLHVFNTVITYVKQYTVNDKNFKGEKFHNLLGSSGM